MEVSCQALILSGYSQTQHTCKFQPSFQKSVAILDAIGTDKFSDLDPAPPEPQPDFIFPCPDCGKFSKISESVSRTERMCTLAQSSLPVLER